MSGVYIPGMEMPKSCGDCRFCGGIADTDCGPCAWCNVDGNARVADTRQDCPLIPAPDHGRLIDADAVYKRLQKQAMSVWGDGNPRYQIILDVMDAIRFGPTIISADKEGEG